MGKVIIHKKNTCALKFLSFICVLFLSLTFLLWGNGSEKIIYVSPQTGDNFVSVNSKILFRSNQNFSVEDYTITVTGTKSGVINGTLKKVKNTLVFTPSNNFHLPEEVTVKIHNRDAFLLKSINFSTAKILPASYGIKDAELLTDNAANPPKNTKTDEITVINGVSVPSDFPFLKPEIIETSVADGKLFMTTLAETPYLMIFKNDGTPYYYKRTEDYYRDFKLHNNGLLTAYRFGKANHFEVFDSNFSVVKHLRADDDLFTDGHEIYMFDDGGYILYGLANREVDMSNINNGGKSEAEVVDYYLQRFSADDELVFNWKSYEYINVEDAIHEDLTAEIIDYVHANSIDVDFDGNYILSFRNQSMCIKVNSTTGEVMWRFGGVQNDFTLIDDTDGISYQHDIKAVPGEPNHYTIFDNGTYHTPPYSRAIEYVFDTENMTATKVWEYRTENEDYAHWMGNAQRLENGNTMINFVEPELPKAVEVTKEGDVVYQANYGVESHAYRTFRFDWQTTPNAPYLVVEPLPDRTRLIFNHFGERKPEKYKVYYGFSPYELDELQEVETPYLDVFGLDNLTPYYFKIASVYADGSVSSYSNVESVLTQFYEPGDNFIFNGDFSEGESYWNVSHSSITNVEYLFHEGNATFYIFEGGATTEDIILYQTAIPLYKGRNYTFRFDAFAGGNKIIRPEIRMADDPKTSYSKTSDIVVRSTPRTFEYQFTMDEDTDLEAELAFEVGGSNIYITIDNVYISETVTDVVDDNIAEPVFNLSQNYPNPFNPVTIINYSIPNSDFVKVEVFNSIGEKISTLVNGVQNAGNHTVQFNGKELASGVYLLKLKAGNFVSVKKMVLIK